MAGDIEQVKQALLGAYESGAPIDVADWTARFPGHRDELVDFWMWLRGTPRLSEIDAVNARDADDGVARETVRQACMAVSLGPQWLDEPVDADAGAESALGAELAGLRATAFQFHGRAPKEFRRAVVFAWIVHAIGVRRPRVTRLAAQKIAYLLEQGLDLGLFTEHEQRALGPYDSRAKYRDAEPIAANSGWISVEGANLKPGSVDKKFVVYVQRYVRSEALAKRLVAHLAPLRDQELETWATLVWAGQALRASRQGVTTNSVREFLAQSPEWRSKLGRPGFLADRIESALTRLLRLQLIRR